MRSYLYLSTAVAGVMMTAGAGASLAQCVTTQNCAELGYTETSCPNGTGIKCPFGDTFACTGGSSEITPEQCTQLGFTHTCIGTNETGGGELCNNKYAFCTCADGYEWKEGSCTKTIPAVSCTIGTLYYSDGTCSNNLESGKTLLGVVIMEKTSIASGWIMTVKPIQTGIMWGGYGTDIPGLTDYTSTPSDVQASCTNTTTITNHGNSSIYPAAWAAKNYSPNGTPSGKSWCLPSGGLLNNINNSTAFTKVNAGITTARGKKIGFGTSFPYESIWSSSAGSSLTAWYFYANTSGSFLMDNYDRVRSWDYVSVRPVLAF